MEFTTLGDTSVNMFEPVNNLTPEQCAFHAKRYINTDVMTRLAQNDEMLFEIIVGSISYSLKLKFSDYTRMFTGMIRNEETHSGMVVFRLIAKLCHISHESASAQLQHDNSMIRRPA